MLEIHGMIKNIVDNKKTASVNVCDGFSFNHFATLNKIYLYQNNQYASGNYDSKGNRKWFFPLHEHRCYNFDKNLDIDLANILLVSRKRDDEFRNWLAHNIIYQELKKISFSTKINEIVQAYSRIGNVVVKQDDDNIFRQVDLRNLYFADYSVESLEDTLTIEKHTYSQSDLLAMKGVWNNVEQAITLCAIKDKPKNSDTPATKTGEYIEPYYEIFETYGEMPESFIKKDGDPSKYKKYQHICAIGENGVSVDLFQSEWNKKKPYKELHLGAYKGTWLRDGVISLLFDLQERYNEVNNQISNSMRLSKKLYTTSKKEKLLQNAMVDLDDGDVIEGDLQRVDDTEINMSAWNAERAFINKAADDICNSYEILTGDSMPSNMPYRLGALVNSNANKLFDFLREKLSIFLTEILSEWADKNLRKALKSKEFTKIINKPEYIAAYNKYMVDWELAKFLTKAAENGEIVFYEDIQNLKPIIEQSIVQNKKKEMPIPQGLFDDFQYDFDIVISGENYNKQSVMETGSNLLQVLGANSPASKSIINKLTTLAGFSPIDWDVEEQAQPQAQQPNSGNMPNFTTSEQKQL